MKKLILVILKVVVFKFSRKNEFFDVSLVL